jgi:hypothetical protein
MKVPLKLHLHLESGLKKLKVNLESILGLLFGPKFLMNTRTLTSQY